MVPLASCQLSGADGGTGGFSREGAGLCTATQAAIDAGTPVFVVNPDLPEACSQIVTGLSGAGTPGVHAPTLPATPYPSTTDAPAGDPCAMAGSLFATQRTVVMPAGGVTFRVNWAGGSPVLEYTQRAPPLAADTWTEVSRDVEQMTVAFGVRDLTTDAGIPLTWFPAAGGGVSIDQCMGMSPGGSCAVPGGMGPPALDPTAWDALMRRVRAVEVRLVARSTRRERMGVIGPGRRKLSSGTSSATPTTVAVRRTLVLTLAPRNYTGGELLMVARFTLLEAMTVCAIVTILAALAVPSWDRAVIEARANDAVSRRPRTDSSPRPEDRPGRDQSVPAGDGGRRRSDLGALGEPPCDNEVFGVAAPPGVRRHELLWGGAALSRVRTEWHCPAGDGGPERLGRALLPGRHRAGGPAHRRGG